MAKNDVLTIENGVVTKCDENAVDVVIPEGVKKIGGSAFRDCKSLSSVVIGEGVTEIGEEAFNGCKSLKSIVIPSTVTEIGEYAFDGCEAVENVVSASASFPFNEKTRKLYDATKKTKKVILVLTAAKEEAKKEKIEQVQLASASAVLDSILSEHKAETEVVRNKTDAYLRVKASDSGIEILLPDSKVQKWMQTLPGLLDLVATGADAGALRKYAADSSLEDASRKYITVSKDGSVKLKKDAVPVYLVIPEGVTEIGWQAFAYCESLTSVVIPEGVTQIDRYAFAYCKSLSSVEFGGTMAQWEAVKGKELNLLRYIPAKTVKCSDGEWQEPVVQVEDGVLVACLDNSATSVSIPEGVKEIGDYAFNDCKSLSSVVIPEGVTEIGKRAFEGCESLLSVVIPASVTEIGYYAFLGCRSLSSVEFGGTVAQWEAVNGKQWLLEYVPAKTVKCSDGEWQKPSLLLVENGVAVKCLDKSATSVTIPEGVTRIRGGAFEDCKLLASVVIPAGVKEIGVSAFEGCESLSSVEFGGTMAQWEAVKRVDYWNAGVPAKTVKCTDGEVSL